MQRTQFSRITITRWAELIYTTDVSIQTEKEVKLESFKRCSIFFRDESNLKPARAKTLHKHHIEAKVIEFTSVLVRYNSQQIRFCLTNTEIWKKETQTECEGRKKISRHNCAYTGPETSQSIIDVRYYLIERFKRQELLQRRICIVICGISARNTSDECFAVRPYYAGA